MSSLRMTYYDEDDFFAEDDDKNYDDFVDRIADAIEERLEHAGDEDTTIVHEGEDPKQMTAVKTQTRPRRLPKPREVAFKSRPKRKMTEPGPVFAPHQRVSARFHDSRGMDQPRVILGGYYYNNFSAEKQRHGSTLQEEPLLYTCHGCHELMTCPHARVVVLRCPFCRLVLMPE